MDWSPNGKWLLVDVRSQDGRTTFLRRSSDNGNISTLATVDDDPAVATIADDGTVYYGSTVTAQPGIATVNGAGPWRLGHMLAVALDWTPTGLVGVFIDIDSPQQDKATVGRAELATDSADLSRIQEIEGTVDFGLASSADGTSLLIGTMTDIGSPVTMTVSGASPAEVVVADTMPKPVGLWVGPTRTLVFYRVVSTARIGSISTDGTKGPPIDLGFDETAFSISGNGTYAIASDSSVLTSARLCTGPVDVSN